MGEKKPSVIANFAIGGFAGCCATSCVQPIDYVKVAIQLAGEGKSGQKLPGPIAVAQKVIREKGFFHLYTGIEAALLRQVVYGTCRLGFYRTFQDLGYARRGTKTLPLWERGVYSLVAGGLAAFIGTPADLVLIRLQSEMQMPPEQRRGYTSVPNCFSRIIKEEGFPALWTGAGPTIVRAMAINLGMLSTYDQVKQWLGDAYGDFTGIRPVSSFIAGFVSCVFSLPFDNVKTKFQKMRPDAQGKLPYKNFSDCFKKTLAKEGAMGFYAGFPTYVVRISPHAIIVRL